MIFQKKMRQMEMENEVMQFQTIILMLMKIERISVEMILEWLERYSNIFKEPIARCVNNYEAGAWEALEELNHREKRKATNDQFISKKGIIGKFVGFAPMICLFVGYLIIPLVFIGLSSMGSAFAGLQ